MGKLANITAQLEAFKGKQTVNESELMKNIEQFISERNKSDSSKNNGIALRRLEESLTKSGTGQSEANKMILGLVGLVMEQGIKIDALKDKLDEPAKEQESIMPELKKLLAEQNKPKDVHFEIVRGSQGFMDEVIVREGKKKARSIPL